MNSQKLFHLKPDFYRLSRFATLVGKYLTTLKQEMILSAGTIRTFGTVLRRFMRYLQEERRLDIEPQHVTKLIVIEYLVWLRDIEGISPRTLPSHGVSLRQFYRWLHGEGLIFENPIRNLRPPKRPRSVPRPLSPEQIARLILVVDSTSRREFRDLVILEVLYGSGLRISEALGLQVQDIVFEHNYLSPHVRVFGKGSKYRVVPLTDHATSLLRTYLSIRGHRMPAAHVFTSSLHEGKKLRIGAFERNFKTYLKRAGLDQRITPHALRHSFATHMMARGSDIASLSSLMGHADMSSTMIYSKVTQEQVIAEFRRTSPRDRMTAPHEDKVASLLGSIDRQPVLQAPDRKTDFAGERSVPLMSKQKRF